MVIDTQSTNKQRVDLTEFEEIWLFGYGSLIYKVDFPYIEKSPATISGWQRRFWQGSHDHRGTPESPGRVLTLVEDKGASCFGMAYRVSEDVFEHLDHREKNGYLRHTIDISLADGKVKKGIIYIGDESNPAFFGPASDFAIAKQIFTSVGPSGKNVDYVTLLGEALRERQVVDRHVFAIEFYLKLLERNASS